MDEKCKSPGSSANVGTGSIESGATSPTKIAMFAEQISVTTQTQESHYNMLTQKLESRIGNYLAKMPESVSGQFGHDKLFDAAKAVVRGFAVEPAEAVELLKKYFNPRCKKPVGRGFEPYPWKDEELEHKCNEALKNSTDDRPRGYLLSDAERARLKLVSPEPKPAENTAAKVTAPPPSQPVDHGPVVETILYHYHDAGRQPHHQVQRRKYADGTKDFYPSHWNGQRYIKGVGDLPRIPYNAAEVAQATHIWFVEGEKCAESLRQYLQRAGKLTTGVAVTCVMGGVNGWKPELTEWFRDKHVCMIPDNDEAGYKFAKKVGENLDGVVASFQVRKWVPETPAKWDIADVVDQLAPGNGIPETPADADIFGVVFPTEQLESPQPLSCLAEVLSAASDAEPPTDTTAPMACPPKSASSWRSPGSVTSQEIADAYIQHILKPENRNLCYTPGEKGKGKWWKYTPLKGWFWIPSEQATAGIMRFVEKYMEAAGDVSELSVTRENSVIRNIQRRLTVLPSDTADEMEENIDPTLWLTFSAEGITAEPAPGWVSCRSHLLNIQPLARRMAENKRLGIPFDWYAPDIHEMLRPVSSSLFARGKIPCAFNPTATAPRWCQFLKEACPDDAQQLQLALGVTLTYINWLNVFFVILGPGGSGKSIAAEIFRAFNQGNTCGVSLGDFDKDFHNYQLTENRLNLLPDMERIRKGKRASRMEMVLKMISGKESKDTQQKYGNAETKSFSSWCVFTVNQFPEFEETTSAISRRLRLIRFPNVFYDTEQQDEQLLGKLLAELNGILNLSLIALGELLMGGHRVFPESEPSKEIKMEEIRAAHPILLFCDTHLELGNPGDFVTSEEVMEVFNHFCDADNLERLASKDAIPAIRENFGFPDKPVRRTIGDSRQRGIAGIRFHSVDKFIALNPCRFWQSSGLREQNR